tara:strand:- start:3680 stop:4060 length:381 start_codon:yes stop_codon:yes gene_type:complete
MVSIVEAQALVQVERDLPVVLEDIERLEKEIEPIKKEIASKKAQIRAFMQNTGSTEYEVEDGLSRWRILLVNKVRKTLNVELVQKAVSKTMWERITKYEDPNGGKKVKKAYVETSSNTLLINREVD